MSDPSKTAGGGPWDGEDMPPPRLDMIGLVVSDMATTLAFYRRLGVDLPPEADGAPHVEVTLPGGLRLAWDTVEVVTSFDPDFVMPTGEQRASLAFLCDDPAAVDATHADLVAAGAPSHLAPFDAPWGQRYATVLDPDGGGIDLFAPLA